jgi:hypothetical protein
MPSMIQLNNFLLLRILLFKQHSVEISPLILKMDLYDIFIHAHQRKPNLFFDQVGRHLIYIESSKIVLWFPTKLLNIREA